MGRAPDERPIEGRRGAPPPALLQRADRRRPHAGWVRVEPHVVRIGLDGVERRQVGQVTVVVTQPEAFGLEDRRHRSTVAGTRRARPPILPS
jgi:hypothetical protein